MTDDTTTRSRPTHDQPAARRTRQPDPDTPIAYVLTPRALDYLAGRRNQPQDEQT